MLIVNLGTPEGTDYRSMRRYLAEFLSDRRVIEAPRLLWAPLLQLILLRRPAARGRDYAAIWNRELNEGPLKTITRSQSAKLAEALKDLAPDVEVDWAMRYGEPPIAGRLAAMQAKGCDRILVVPLYPQYCAASTATVGDKAFDTLKAMRWQPSIRLAAPWYDEPVYIDALARSTREGLARLDFTPEVVLASFHGIPQAYFDKGDPYYCQCAKTTRLLRLGARMGGRTSADDLPVALRPGRMAEALYRRHGAGPRRKAASSASPSSPPASSPTASRRWRRSRSRTPAIFARPAASRSPPSPASTTAPTAWR